MFECISISTQKAALFVNGEAFSKVFFRKQRINSTIRDDWFKISPVRLDFPTKAIEVALGEFLLRSLRQDTPLV